MTTIFETLRHEHDEHRELLARVADTSGDSEERKLLFERLARELRSHAAAEERSFYAQIMSVDMTTEKARHSVAEHKEVDDFLEELEAREMSDPHWLTTFKKLRERVEHHMEEEEHEVFQMAGKVLTEAQKTQLAERYEREKSIEMEQHA